MAPSPTKRARLSSASPSGRPAAYQANLKDLFARPAPVTHSNEANAAGNREAEELEWAIQESLREEAERKARLLYLDESSAGSSGEHPGRGPDSDLVVGSNSSAPVTTTDQNDRLDRPQIRPLQMSTEYGGEGSGMRSASSAVTVSSIASLSDTDSRATPATPNTTDSEVSLRTPSESMPAPPMAAKAKNAFSRLMSTHSEAKEWATADVVEANNYSGAARSRPQRRTAPFYKILTGMPICVDGFRFGEIEGCQAYFLSHFHADHYGGMTSTWNHGPVYCSVTTANLVRSSLRVQDQYVYPLPMNETVVVPRTGGVRVTLLDANHCPGSCVFLFEGPQTQHILPAAPGYTHPPLPPPTTTFRYLHCGDFRASPRHINHPLIKGKRLDIIYLDTTYCNPRYCFPAQEMVVNACADLVRRAAPEQCRQGQLMHAKDETREDWLSGPLSKREQKRAIEEQESKKGADALRGWLKGEEDKEELIEAVNGESNEAADDDEAFPDGTQFRDEASDIFGARPFDDDDKEDLDTEVRVKAEPVDDDDSWQQSLDTVDDVKCEEGDLQNPVSEATAPVKREDVEVSPSIKKEVSNEMTETKPLDDYTRLLVVVGTYTIGKEKIVLACARALGTKIYCTDAFKYRVYAQLEDDELHSLLTRDPLQAYVHVTSLRNIGGDALKEHASRMQSLGLRVDRAIAFRPTGWTYRPPNGMDTVSPSLDRLLYWNQRRSFGPAHLTSTRDSTARHTIYGVPYSEHSSFFELTAFCLSCDYGRIIATVNVGTPNSRAKMARWFERWKAEKKRRDGRPVEPRSADYF